MMRVRWAMAMMVAAGTFVSAAAQDAPAPASGARLVFFDWGKPVISQDAAGILNGVAEAYRRNPGAQLILSGHTDRSGPPAVNCRSGLARAEAVRAYLADHGIPKGAMTVVTYGESRMLVPTEDGVREPQNRRVEISGGDNSEG